MAVTTERTALAQLHTIRELMRPAMLKKVPT